jgi:cytochrome-b5 reductase
MDQVVCLAGGTGVTPMLQICNDVLQNPGDGTALRLIVANSTVPDIMMHDKLNAIARGSRDQLKLLLVVSRMDATERERHPHLVEASLRKGTFGRATLEAAGVDMNASARSRTMVCVCGPPGWCEAAVALARSLDFEDIMVW